MFFFSWLQNSQTLLSLLEIQTIQESLIQKEKIPCHLGLRDIHVNSLAYTLPDSCTNIGLRLGVDQSLSGEPGLRTCVRKRHYRSWRRSLVLGQGVWRGRGQKWGWRQAGTLRASCVCLRAPMHTYALAHLLKKLDHSNFFRVLFQNLFFTGRSSHVSTFRYCSSFLKTALKYYSVIWVYKICWTKPLLVWVVSSFCY